MRLKHTRKMENKGVFAPDLKPCMRDVRVIKGWMEVK